MNKNYLVLADEDFGRSISISRATDLFGSESEADYEATVSVSEGCKAVYVYQLVRVYYPKVKEGERRVEEVFVGPDGE